MVETIEYIMGFAISTSVAVFSIFALSGTGPLIGRFVSDAGRAQLVDTARQAVLANSTASVSLNLSGTSIRCDRGLMTVSSSGGNYSSEIGSDCSLSITGLSGVHKLTFVFDGRQLRARVDG